MRNVVIFFILLVNTVPSFGAFTTIGNNYYGGFNSRLRMNQPRTVVSSYQPNYVRPYYNNFSPRRLNKLERYALKKNYRGESNIERLERLEELAFGAVQRGDYLTRYNNVERAVLSRPNYGYKRTVLGNIANFLTGQPTGFTPSITAMPSVLTQDLTPGYIPGLGNGFGTNFSPFNMGNSPIRGNYMNLPSNFFETAGYGNTEIEGYSNGFGGGYGVRSNNYNSGVGVKILD